MVYKIGLNALTLSLLFLVVSQPLNAVAIYSELSLADFAEIARSEGYVAEHKQMSDGTEYVLWKYEGKAGLFRVNERGDHVLFHTSWSQTGATLRWANDQNAKLISGRVYIDDEGDPVYELDLWLTGGVTRARIVDFLSDCQLLIRLARRSLDQIQ